MPVLKNPFHASVRARTPRRVVGRLLSGIQFSKKNPRLVHGSVRVRIMG